MTYWLLAASVEKSLKGPAMKTGLTLLLYAECPDSLESFLSIFLQWIIREQPWGQEENRIPPPSQADDCPAYGPGWCMSPLSAYPAMPWSLQLSRQKGAGKSFLRERNSIYTGGHESSLACEVYEPNPAQGRRRLSPYLPPPGRVFSAVGWRCCNNEDPLLCVRDGLNI